MNPQHKWYAVAKQWVEGKEIQFRKKEFSEWSEWKTTNSPNWFTDNGIEYRVKPEPHKHQEFINAFNAGKSIQFWSTVSKDWVDSPDPTWNNNFKYRIKPKDIVVRENMFLGMNGRVLCYEQIDENVEFTFDVETKKLKSVKML